MSATGDDGNQDEEGGVTQLAVVVVKQKIGMWLLGIIGPFLIPILLVIGLLMAVGGVASSSSESCSSGAVIAPGGNNTEKAFNFLEAKPELTPTQAAAIVGNLIHENGNDPLNPNQYNTAGSGAFGIAQWLGGRLTGPEGLQNYKFQGRDWKTDIDLQLNFLWWELKERPATSGNALALVRNAKSLREAVEMFEGGYPNVIGDGFERSGDTASYPRRIANAERVLREYGNGVGGNPLDPGSLDISCLGLGTGDLSGSIKIDKSPGHLVPVPGFPSEKVDSRVLPNLVAIMKKYKADVGDCYVSPAELGPHERTGEHPLGVGCDMHPDLSKGGTWELIDQLAAWAEPTQNNPREPFRWVGYNGDANHGKYNHIHLSWDHAPAEPFTIPSWVKVIG